MRTMTEPNRSQAPLRVGDIVTLQGIVSGVYDDEGFAVIVRDSQDIDGLLSHSPEIYVPASNVRRTITAYTEEPQHD